jgi:NADH:ubiquinone oxidoreductase subunit E
VVVLQVPPRRIPFENDASRAPTGKAKIVACKTAYRRRKGGENIMEALSEMVNARMLAH